MKGLYLRFGLFVLAALAFAALAFAAVEETTEEVSSPIYMKGVCYHPVAKGDTIRSFERIDEDLALMVDAGMNTIHVRPRRGRVLDKIAAKGLKIVVGFG